MNSLDSFIDLQVLTIYGHLITVKKINITWQQKIMA